MEAREDSQVVGVPDTALGELVPGTSLNQARA